MTAEAYWVSERQVYKLAKQKRETGSVALRTSQRGRKPKMSDEDLQRLKAEIQAHPDRSGLDVQEKRKQWKESVAELQKTKLVFPDESGVNANMTRRYGRATGKQRVADAAPLNTPKTTIVLSAMRLDGQSACRTFEGGTIKDHFLEYLLEDMLPCLKKGDIVGMDNLRAHHTRAWKNCSALQAPCRSICLLTAFNPIEKMWSRMKAILRKLRIRSQDLPDPAVREALSGVSASNCKGWFQGAGY